MWATIPLWVMGAITFWGQELPGARVEAPDPLSGAVHCNYFQADLDRDGAADLVFAREVMFQREDAFPPASRVPLPEVEQPADLDIWKDEVFMRGTDRLLAYAWTGAAWEEHINQPFDWPGSEGSILPGRPAAGFRLERFLQDIDGDGVPEILTPRPEGVYVHRQAGREYRAAGMLGLVPAPVLAVPAVPRVWPPVERQLSLPARDLWCRLSFDGKRVRLVTQERAPATQMRYHCVEYETAFDAEGQARPVKTDERVFPNRETNGPGAFSDFMQPCMLNEDATIDFAGTRWESATAAPVAGQILAVWATLDGGRTFTVRRSAAFRPRYSFVDFDGDADLDLVFESANLRDGGLRESVARGLAARSFDHEVIIYTQTLGEYGDEPALRARFSVRLDRPPLYQSPFFMRYQRDGVSNLSGDFNADGYKDLAIQDTPDRIAIYFAAGFNLSEQPDAVLTVEPQSTFAVDDVNRDGRSDLLVRSPAGAAPNARIRLFLTREKRP